jgi:membrane protease YdiL (CAAX protease family)
MKIFRGGYDPKRVVEIGTGDHPAVEDTGAISARLDVEPHATGLPDRYSVKEHEKQRTLTCTEAPTLKVKVERGYSVSAAAARKFPPGSIFLDGAAQGEPFLDLEKQVYNLDHHEGCVRSFTLAACEQAMILVRKRIPLRERDWTIYAGEPDLDTILAIWILLNHIRLNDQDPEIRRSIMPLVRLQGTIDAHGLEMQEIAGLPEDLHEKTFARLEELRSRELTLKKDGRWQEIDFLEYTAGMLRAIDAMVYSSEHFEGAVPVEELARAEIASRWLAIACASETGIYAVEQQLRRLHGDRLGIIILRKDQNTYTLRRADPSLPLTFERVYEQLNLMDPAAGSARSGNRWGGSDDIGGSPRSSGTELTPQEIVDICSKAHWKPSRPRQIGAVAEASLASALFALAAIILVFLERTLSYRLLSFTDELLVRNWYFVSISGFLSLSLLLFKARKAPRIYGMRQPAAYDWLYLLVPAILAGAAGGARFPELGGSTQPWLFRQAWSDILMVLGFAGAVELLFRGVVHGILFRSFRAQKVGGKWFISWPVVISSILYCIWACFPYVHLTWPEAVYPCLAGFVLAIACGMARERSGSIVAPIVLHWVSILIPVLNW